MAATPGVRERLCEGGGRVTLPEGAGLGGRGDEAYVRKHAVTVTLD